MPTLAPIITGAISRIIQTESLGVDDLSKFLRDQ
jgi:hypothetical protein